MMLLYHQQQNNLPAFEMFEQNFSLFNEECGEASFSVLGRMVHGNATKKDIESMEQAWIRIHEIQEIDEEMERDSSRKFKSDANHRKTIKPDSHEVRATVELFRGKIRQMKHDCFTVYGDMKALKSMAAASSYQVPFERTKEFWQQSTVTWLKNQRQKADKFTGAWGYQFAHLWAEMDPFNVAAESESQCDGEDDEEELLNVPPLHVQQPKRSNKPRKQAAGVPAQKKNRKQNGKPVHKRRRRSPSKTIPQRSCAGSESSSDETSGSMGIGCQDQQAIENVPETGSVQSHISAPRKIDQQWAGINVSNIVSSNRKRRRKRRQTNEYIAQPADHEDSSVCNVHSDSSVSEED